MICKECQKVLTNSDAYGHDCEILTNAQIWDALKILYQATRQRYKTKEARQKIFTLQANIWDALNKEVVKC